MINYKTIDENFLSYGVRQLNWAEFFDIENVKIHQHEWVNVPVETVFTELGLKFFDDRGIKLRKTTRLFRIEPNYSSAIHIDSDYYDAAFNFIVEGTSEMQWVTLHGGVEKDVNYIQSNSNTGSFKRFDVYDSLTIDDSWSGKCALVKINVPHRVIGGPTKRYCVSVRPHEDHFFDDIMKII